MKDIASTFAETLNFLFSIRPDFLSSQDVDVLHALIKMHGLQKSLYETFSLGTRLARYKLT
jgi:hypothetical protein